MDYAADRSTPRRQGGRGRLWGVVREYATPKVTAAFVIWRFESYTVTPMVILCIELFGRWNGALVVGAVMSVYAAIFLFLLERERALDALREWLRERRMVRQFVLPVKNSEGLAGAAGRWLAAPGSVMVLSAFERGVAYRVLDLKNRVAYPLSCLGQFPRSLFWVGVVFGSAWELVFKPAIAWIMEMPGDLLAPIF